MMRPAAGRGRRYLPARFTSHCKLPWPKRVPFSFDDLTDQGGVKRVPFTAWEVLKQTLCFLFVRCSAESKTKGRVAPYAVHGRYVLARTKD
jgi:hypothetical protein